jgi:hypothetical protein
MVRLGPLAKYLPSIKLILKTFKIDESYLPQITDLVRNYKVVVSNSPSPGPMLCSSANKSITEHDALPSLQSSDHSQNSGDYGCSSLSKLRS